MAFWTSFHCIFNLKILPYKEWNMLLLIVSENMLGRIVQSNVGNGGSFKMFYSIDYYK